MSKSGVAVTRSPSLESAASEANINHIKYHEKYEKETVTYICIYRSLIEIRGWPTSYIYELNNKRDYFQLRVL